MTFRNQKPGYLVIDHRESPGMVATGNEKPGTIMVGKGQLFEADTLQCAHCNATFIKNPARVRPRGYCAKCDHYVCDNPACGLECKPFKKLLDDLQEQAARTT